MRKEDGRGGERGGRGVDSQGGAGKETLEAKHTTTGRARLTTNEVAEHGSPAVCQGVTPGVTAAVREKVARIRVLSTRRTAI